VTEQHSLATRMSTAIRDTTTALIPTGGLCSSGPLSTRTDLAGAR
jgi:hypothetical protein